MTFTVKYQLHNIIKASFQAIFNSPTRPNFLFLKCYSATLSTQTTPSTRVCDVLRMMASTI